MKSITLSCPGKANLFLDVSGKRMDGYHLIDSLFIPVQDIADALTVSLTDQVGITINCTHPEVPCNQKNLVCKAAKYFSEETGIEPHWHIDITKEIPVAGGMGGGSSNAASTLMALNELYDYPINKLQLEELAIKIGADVPFFLYKSAALVNGIGEIVNKVKIQQNLFFIFVPFNFPIAASWAYKNRDPKFGNSKSNSKEYLELLNKGLNPKSYNDLEKMARIKFPILDNVCNKLIELGAFSAIVSGSGPTCFGIFDERKKRDRALNFLDANSLPANHCN